MEAVSVRIMNLKWMYRYKKNFVALVQKLSACKDTNIFGTSFITSLLDTHWEENQTKIFWY